MGYTTRGRADELEKQIAAMEARMELRLDQLEKRVRHAETFGLDLVRAFVAAGIAVVRERVSNGPAEEERSA